MTQEFFLLLPITQRLMFLPNTSYGCKWPVVKVLIIHQSLLTNEYYPKKTKCISLYTNARERYHLSQSLYPTEMGYQITCKKECDDVKTMRPLLLSIFKTSNEMCSSYFMCAQTFTVYKPGKLSQTSNSAMWTFNTQIIIKLFIIILHTA